MNKLTASLFLLLMITISSCDDGLSPGPGTSITPGFSGTVKFFGDWPQDVKSTYVVLFKDSLKSAADFNAVNLKYVSTLIPEGTREFEFSTLTDISFGQVNSGRYAYLAVAQSTSPVLSLVRSAWRVAGVYKSEDSQVPSGTIIVPANKFLTGIEIVCDFNNPPIQPPN